MSLRAQAMVESWDVAGTSYAVLSQLAYYADEFGDNSCPSVGTIAGSIHRDEKTVRRVLHKLCELGYIKDMGESGFRTRIYAIQGMDGYSHPDPPTVGASQDDPPTVGAEVIVVGSLVGESNQPTTEIRGTSRLEDADDIYAHYLSVFDPENRVAPMRASRSARDKIRKATLEATPEACKLAILGARNHYQGHVTVENIFTVNMQAKGEGKTLADRISWLSTLAGEEIVGRGGATPTSGAKTKADGRVLFENGTWEAGVAAEIRSKYPRRDNERTNAEMRAHIQDLWDAGYKTVTEAHRLQPIQFYVRETP